LPSALGRVLARLVLSLRTELPGTLTREPFGDAQAYVARAEFMPLVMLSENAATPSEGYQGGRVALGCPSGVARGRFVRCTTRFLRRFASELRHEDQRAV